MSIFPTAYLPPIEYFVMILKEEKIVIEKHETYPKQTYRNRCNIFQANGLLSLIIPVSKPNGNRTLTKDIQISNTESWQRNHWRAIESAYNKSPFFLYYCDDLIHYYQNPVSSLIDFNTEILFYVLNKFGLKHIDISFSEEYQKNDTIQNDYRGFFHPKKKLQTLKFPLYHQVFEYKYGFLPNLSVLDLLFNIGPQAKDYIEEVYNINFSESE